MMVKKMAGFFSILGVLIFLGNWLYLRMLPEQEGARPMDAEKAWEIGIYLAAGFFMLGLFVSTLGIALVQEALAESRSRDTEKKFRARASYDHAMSTAEAAASAQPGAAGGDGE